MLQKGEFCSCVRQLQAKIQSYQLHNCGLIFSEFLEPHACQGANFSGNNINSVFIFAAFLTSLLKHRDFVRAHRFSWSPFFFFLWYFRLSTKELSVKSNSACAEGSLLLPGRNGLPNIGVKAVGKRDTVFYYLLWFGFFYSITQKIGK